MLVYKATNKINGNVYIGQTQFNLGRRRSEHISKAGKGSLFYFHKAIHKYGKDNFKWDIIYRTDKLDNLNRMEQYMIIFYQAMDRDFGYNMESGGENYERSAEIREKMRQRMLGDKNPMYGMCGDKNPMFGVRLMGKKNPMWGRRGKDSPNYGKKHTPETKEKIRKALIGKKKTSTHIENNRQAQLKYWATIRGEA